MTLAITHTFVSAIADDAAAQAAGEVLPSHWNAALSTSMATAKVLGRTTAGTGVIQELSITGTGNIVFDTSPTLITPLLGTPTSGVLSNCTGLPAAAIVAGSFGTGNYVVTGTATINPAANASALIVSGGSITGSGTTVPGITVAGTLNTSGSVVGAGLLINITNTASGSSTTLLDVGVGGGSYTSKFLVDPAGIVVLTGQLRAASGSSSAPGLSIAGNSTGFYTLASGYTAYSGLGTPGLVMGSDGIGFNPTAVLYWHGSAPFTTVDTGMRRSAARVVQIDTGASSSSFGDLKLRHLLAESGVAIPAGGTAGVGLAFSSTANFGIFFGSSAPTLAAGKGSLYLRSDGSGATDRAYINTDGSTTWTNLVTAG